jgi:PAS domain S-box-containing protein
MQNNAAHQYNFSDEQINKAILEFSEDQIIITDPEGIILYINPASQKITGFSQKELLGTKAGEKWGGLMEPGFYQNMWDTIKNQKKTFSAIVHNKRKNDELYDSFITIVPIIKNDKITNFVGIEKDITQESEISKMKSEFLSLASHQLRTPLTTIKWSSEMLSSQELGELNNDQEIMASNIHEANEILIEIVNTFLDVTKLEAGKMKPQPVPTKLKQLISDIIYLVSEQINTKKQKLDLHMDDSIDLVNIDPKLIRQVYLNLLSNAVKYSPDKSQIDVEIKIENNFLFSSVTDHGQGIPEEDKDKIFTRFFRAGNAVQKVPEGNGLGLYFVKIIVEACNGEVGFKTEEHKGTQFWFKIPLTLQKIDPQAHAKTKASSTAQTINSII